MYELATYVMYFMIYACMGYAMEVVKVSARKGELTDRGFLKGPACPIYGVGMVAMLFLTRNFTESPVLVFLITMVMCMVLEYATSYIMEKLFKARWWDYSNRPLNLNGRICLGYSLAFGFGGIIMSYLIHPIVAGAVAATPEVVVYILAGTASVGMAIDVVYSTCAALEAERKKPKSWLRRLFKRG